MLALTGGAVVGLAIFLYSWSSQTSFVTLYSGLDASDSGRIVEQLRSQGVPFELEGGGTTVLVPESQVDEMRVNFAAQGLPEGGVVGFEIFEGNSFTATDFVQRLNFQRGLQGELSRTIEAFNAVDSARVHIVLPERSLFREDQTPATASIVLRLRSGMRLSSSEIGGIAKLVSGAVEGLQMEHISILDTGGSVLFDGAQQLDDTVMGSASRQLDIQRAYEQALERDAQELLDRSLGLSRGVVTVRAILNFDSLEIETETFEVGGDSETPGIPRSTTTIEEAYTTSGASVASGVPGAVANIPGADTNLDEASTAAGSTVDYSRTETVSNFEVGRTVTRTTQAPGEIERLTVSLLLDDTVPEEQIQPLTDAVSAAVGLDTERGDTMAVTRFTFDRTAIDEATAAFESAESTQQLLGYARIGLPVILLIVAFIFFRLLIRSIDSRSYRLAATPQGALSAGGTGAAGLSLPAAAQRPTLPPPPERDEVSEVQQAVSSLVTGQPETVTDIVQSWLRE